MRFFHTLSGVALLGVALLGLALPTATASAQPTASERELARREFRNGLAAAKEGEWAVALKSFQTSYDLYERPITLLNLAGARAQNGMLLEAAEAYRSFIREAKDPDQAQLKKTAEQVLAEVDQRLPKVRVKAMGIEDSDVLSLDGTRISNAAVGELLPVNPGPHQISLTRPGRGSIAADFQIREHEWRTVVLDASPERWPEDQRAELREEVETRQGKGDGTVPVFGEDGALTGTEDGYPDEEEESGGILESPWFWVSAAVVLIGGGVLGYFLIADGDSQDPHKGNIPPFRVGIE